MPLRFVILLCSLCLSQQGLSQIARLHQGSVDKGISWEIGYIGESFANLNGGDQTGMNYLGFLNLAGEFSVRPSSKIAGMSLILNVMNVHGSSISDLIGDDLLASNIDALPSTRLQNLFLQHHLLDSSLIIRVGKQAIDEEFLTTDFSNLFLHMAAAYPFTLSLNAAPWPAAALGLTVSYQLNSEWKIQGGILNADPNITDETVNRTGLKTYLKPSGHFLISEAVYEHEGQFLRLGVMHDTNPYQDRFGQSFRGMTAIYATGDWDLCELGSRKKGKLCLFATASSTLQWNLAPIDYDLRGALIWKHQLEGGKEQQLGLGYFYPHVGDAARTDTRLDVRTEHFAEITYLLGLTNFIKLQSSFQYILNPGGASGSNLRNALVAAFRMNITL